MELCPVVVDVVGGGGRVVGALAHVLVHLC